jgi:hypothetical protein
VIYTVRLGHTLVLARLFTGWGVGRSQCSGRSLSAVMRKETCMDRSQIREKIRHFLLNDLIRMSDYDLLDDEPLITGGLIGSFDLALYGSFVKKELGVFIPDIDLTVANLDTLDQMVNRVMQDLK